MLPQAFEERVHGAGIQGLGGGGRKPLRLSARSCGLRPLHERQRAAACLIPPVTKITFLPLGTLR